MSKFNCTRPGCRDVFHSCILYDADYDGDLEIPRLGEEHAHPKKLIPFSRALKSQNYDGWIHFYEDDVKFERIWNNPHRYLPILQKFEGLITPDFSIYRDMPLVMQEWNTFRSRAIGHLAQANNLRVIANIRTGDERSWQFCCKGVVPGSTIAVGSHGCLKDPDDRSYFIRGLSYSVNEIHPDCIIVYGTAPEYIFSKYKDSGISVLSFESDYSLSRKEVNH